MKLRFFFRRYSSLLIIYKDATITSIQLLVGLSIPTWYFLLLLSYSTRINAPVKKSVNSNKPHRLSEHKHPKSIQTTSNYFNITRILLLYYALTECRRQIKMTNADTTKDEILLFLLTGLAKHLNDKNTDLYFSHTQKMNTEKSLFDLFHQPQLL